ncbi:hypothetical protein [Fundidesulfovibrio terrae]|uniref:hypothetical protein n=1 Tax=Fundidesulfovibrio terrae TaxID=2922866 RepID=UPI001FAF52B7|nr:hypothetical protein [Fundidesulfovibrio terrae]
MRTEQELKENQARYWRRSNAAFGVPAGTHPDDPNPPGADNFQQAGSAQPSEYLATQQPMGDFPRYDDVHAALLRDPEAVATLREHWDDVFRPHDMGPPPADPTGQLRWYILRDLNEHHHKRHRIDFEDAKKHRVRERVETLFGKLAQSDPLYKGTIQMMEHHLELLSPSLRRMVRGMFARCPHEALEFYKEMRAGRPSSPRTTKETTHGG